MNDMKVCFIGVGSIAKRHIRNLRAICKERGIELSIDAFRRTYKPGEDIDRIYCDEKNMPADYDAIFITNPTDQHFDTLKRFHDRGKHFFIEKPVVTLFQIMEAREFQLNRDAVYYVACPLRYNAVIQWVKRNVNPDDVISVRSISSSYLPEWRPGQDYRNTYSAHKDMGGGVSIDLIHEWDYLTYLFGWPKNVHSLTGKISSLEIDSDDYAIYIAEYKDKIVELHLDYFGRKTIRKIQLFTKNDTIVGDIANNKIKFLFNGQEIDFHEERDDFQKRELRFFLDMITGKTIIEDGYHHGINVLNLTQGKL
ncbi:MAG: Gfo/Idh/MocA family oxidoreductase [Lachnospiraceae bacterium]|jgi:predicted dehydrogenase|nr:Gfo/Idh/MocA family oxidoreductase [Lachnospiraceae bacterium]